MVTVVEVREGRGLQYGAASLKRASLLLVVTTGTVFIVKKKNNSSSNDDDDNSSKVDLEIEMCDLWPPYIVVETSLPPQNMPNFPP